MALGFAVKVDLPGLMRERMPSGAYRWRVRVAGDKSRKIGLTVGPDHPDFTAQYNAARAGGRTPIEPEIKAVRGSVAWLAANYIKAMDGLKLHPATIKQRTYFLGQLVAEYGDYSFEMRASDVVKMRDDRSATPGAADNFVKTLRAMYSWATERCIADENPAAGVRKINRDGKGATPWTVADLAQYRERHPPGTMAHLALTLFMFTAGRISEVYCMGRGNEVDRQGIVWLDWNPRKAGASRVQIPMVPTLFNATRAMTLQHPRAYLLTDHGRPFASSAAFSNKFAAWCAAAGLPHLSSHGIRKAAGEFLALSGATQYQIMAIHGHSSAKTSQVYTQGVERAKLAGQGMDLIANLDW